MQRIPQTRLVLLTTIVFMTVAGLFTACKKDKEEPCYTQPAASSLKFRLLDAGGIHDLFIDSTYHLDSLQATQPCNTNKLVTVTESYNLSGSGAKAIAFSFPMLRTPQLSEGVDCFEIYLQLNSQVVDTIYWSYVQTPINDCSAQVVDAVYDNNTLLQKVYDGYTTYYAIKK